MMEKALIFVALLRWAWMFTVLIGTAYIVFWLGYSGWWFLLAILLMAPGNTEVELKK